MKKIIAFSAIMCLVLFVQAGRTLGLEQRENSPAQGSNFSGKELTMTMTKILQQYTGRSPRVNDPLMRIACHNDMSGSEYWYGRGTADWDQKATQVALNEETADYLYTNFTPLNTHYVPGSRPVLERIVNRVIRPEMSEREKVFAILKYCHGGFLKEFPDLKGKFFLNMMEEELLKSGGGQCEDRSRLICCLCQIAGIPARFVASCPYFLPEQGYTLRGGHAIVEIYLESGWAFFDSLGDFYCLKQDGGIASLWELICNPQLVETQPESVHKDCQKTKEQFVKYRDDNLTKKQVVTLTNYYVWDYWRYDWKWIDYGERRQMPEYSEYGAKRRQSMIKELKEIGVPESKIK